MKKNDLVRLARERLTEALDADETNRLDAEDDLKFINGDQWPEQARRERENANRPTLTVNRLPQFVRQVTGDIRQMNPAIKVTAADNSATDSVATVIEGLVRHIEQRSSASSVYEASAESAAQCSMGAFRVMSEYCDGDTFEQELWIKPVHNPFSVAWDPMARLPTRADAEFCFITEYMRKEDFTAQFPKADPVGVEGDNQIENISHWHNEGEILVSEYYWKEYETVTLSLMEDGSVKQGKVEGAVKVREAERCKVKWAKISGKDILEGPRDIPGRHIPVIAVIGEEMLVDGEWRRSSVIRFAKDPQQAYNYASSTQTEVIAMQPKSPFVGTFKQFQGLEKFWAKANTSTAAYLPYNPDEKAPGAPQRQTPPVASQGLAGEIMKAAEDMQATVGIYNASLGNRSNETSGVAIRQRQMESDVSTSIYSDNLAKAIEHCGRILVDQIPTIYDTQRTIRILGEDDQEVVEHINTLVVDPATGEQLIYNPLDVGKYDVRVNVGPNYATRRQEASESMLNFMQAVPQAGQVAPDLIAKAQDWPDADKIAERLKRMLPPGVLGPEEVPEDQAKQLAAQQAQQMQAQQMQGEIEMRKANAEVQEAEADAQKAQFEAMEKQLEIALASGQMDAAISDAVARALQGLMQPI